MNSMNKQSPGKEIVKRKQGEKIEKHIHEGQAISCTDCMDSDICYSPDAYMSYL